MTPPIQTLQLSHLPPTHSLHIALYRNLTNASFLHQQLLAGNTDFEYAFIDASIVVSKVHALAAAYRAINDLLSSRLRSRNVHSEIVFSFSMNNNIAESFRRFGITPATTNLLVIKVAGTEEGEAIQRHLDEVVEGEKVVFGDEELREMVDMGRVRKVYKLNSGGGGGGGKKGVNGVVNGKTEVDERRELEVLVLGAMALRGATN